MLVCKLRSQQEMPSSLSLPATAYTYTFKNVVMKVDVTWHKPRWSPRKEYFLQFVPHQATSAWTELSCGLPNQFADLEAHGFSGAVTMLERRSCRQASSSKLWHPSLLASWALVRVMVWGWGVHSQWIVCGATRFPSSAKWLTRVDVTCLNVRGLLFS